ncbi:Integral membrane protein OS=Streptomyces alboniger OX=132473 GN=CP975_16965 PE=4 SV=1 [Streptomyces alboniger]
MAVVAVIGLHEFQRTAAGRGVVRVLSEVRADQPLWLSLLRTPVSVFVPAVDLPVWGGLPRLFLAFALAELVFGRLRTLAVAYVATLAGTMGARVLIALGPGRAGLPADAAHAVDTGASAAVVGLFAYTAVALRAPVLFVAAVVPTVAGSIAYPGLAGREHLIAVAAAVVMGAAPRRKRPVAPPQPVPRPRTSAGGGPLSVAAGRIGGSGSGGPA